MCSGDGFDAIGLSFVLCPLRFSRVDSFSGGSGHPKGLSAAAENLSIRGAQNPLSKDSQGTLSVDFCPLTLKASQTLLFPPFVWNRSY